ncbi:MAG: hypothetical protein SOU85_00875, partial [Candidatus Cryptobacteroides sp.]|nr:hypothetical protein [Candidatus Cryptobacteroides sp.]
MNRSWINRMLLCLLGLFCGLAASAGEFAGESVEDFAGDFAGESVEGFAGESVEGIARKSVGDYAGDSVGKPLIPVEKAVVLGDEREDIYLPIMKGRRVAVFSNHSGIVGDRSEGLLYPAGRIGDFVSGSIVPAAA